MGPAAWATWAAWAAWTTRPPAPGEGGHRRVGVGHPSGDPARHRVFEVRASYDPAAGGGAARVGEQNRNDQRGDWGKATAGEARARAFPTPAACLGDAVAALVARVDREAAGPAATTDIDTVARRRARG